MSADDAASSGKLNEVTNLSADEVIGWLRDIAYTANETIRELIFQQIPKDILRRVAVDLGMRTLKSSAVDKVLEGVTTVEEVYRVVAM